MSIQVVDNFLPEDLFTELSEIIPYEVPWHYNNGSVYEGDGYPQFVHSFYDENKPEGDFADDMLNIVNEINDLYCIYRIKVNATPKAETLYLKPYHIDVEDNDSIPGQIIPAPLKICILMINTNNGYTQIKDDKGMIHKFKSVANRALFFPNSYEHTGTNCTDEHLRLVLNIVYA